ncbi:hypothetical protein C7E18_06695 [Stenotrophomonas maltophilia]|nr:hypothetical protein C7E18_06695 [Stenotrophomonas maltophilia]
MQNGPAFAGRSSNCCRSGAPLSQGARQRRGGLGAWLAWGPRFAEQSVGRQRECAYAPCAASWPRRCTATETVG